MRVCGGRGWGGVFHCMHLMYILPLEPPSIIHFQQQYVLQKIKTHTPARTPRPVLRQTTAKEYCRSRARTHEMVGCVSSLRNQDWNLGTIRRALCQGVLIHFLLVAVLIPQTTKTNPTKSTHNESTPPQKKQTTPMASYILSFIIMVP